MYGLPRCKPLYIYTYGGVFEMQLLVYRPYALGPRVDAPAALCHDGASMMQLRPRRVKPDAPAAPAAAPSYAAANAQRALRLGWSLAETFGRLRAYRPEFANKRNDPAEMPRFSFSNTDLSTAQQLEVSYRRLVELSAALGLEPPQVALLERLSEAGVPHEIGPDDRKRVHEQLESWSRAAWVQLNVRSAALGRAMTYGGSLSDTFWYMAEPGTPEFVSGRRSADALLRPQRVRRMRERMEELRTAFAPELCDAIDWSLHSWILNDAKLAWARSAEWSGLGVNVGPQPRRTPAQQFHFNLGRQVRTWRDLLFESRQTLDYVSPGYRRRANIIAGAITILAVIGVAVLAGLLIFALFNLLLGVLRGPLFPSFGNSEIIEVVSVGVSLLSTLAILIAGLLSRASAAVQQLDAAIESAIMRRAIRKQTTVPWNEPPRKPEETR